MTLLHFLTIINNVVVSAVDVYDVVVYINDVGVVVVGFGGCWCCCCACRCRRRCWLLLSIVVGCCC